MTGILLTFPVVWRRPRMRTFVAALADRWERARRLRETRRYIQQMDDHMLSDIGISRAQALFEIDRLVGR